MFTNEVLWGKIKPHLKKLKGPRANGEYRALCPLHTDTDPSLNINPEKGVWCCHGACDRGGMLWELASEMGILNDQRPTEYSQQPVATPKEADAELDRRGIRPETRQHFHIKTDARSKAWVFPVRGGQRFKRWPGNEGNKAWHDTGTPNQLYDLESIPENIEAIYYVSGEPDVWIMWQVGLPAICHLFGDGHPPDNAADELRARDIREVRIIADLDDAGRSQEQAVVNALRDSGLAAKVLALPGHLGEKGDLNDLYLWCGKDDEVFRQTVETLPAREIATALVSTENQTTTPIIATLLSTIPDLPKAARLTPAQEQQAQEASAWLNEYTTYVSAISPQTPLLFHEAGGLWLGALAIARRLVLCMAHGLIYPNLFVLWIAPTTLYAKSTGLNEARNILNTTMPYLRLPGELTPEALMAEMSGREPTGLDSLPEDDRQLWQKGRNFAAQRGIFLDEANTLFVGLKRDYNIGLGELLMRLYDCADKHVKSTRGGGYFVARDAYLSFLGATTPGGLRKADLTALWETGLWVRFALLAPDGPPDPARSKDVERPAIITDTLIRLMNDLGCPTYPDTPKARSVALETEVFAAWERYDKATRFDLLTSDTPPDERLWGIYGRLPTQALKVAIILSALEWSDGPPPCIEMRHWYKAQMVAESWRVSAHRLLERLNKPCVLNELDKERRIFAALREVGQKGITARDVSKQAGVRYQETKKLLEALASDGEIERFEYKSTGRGRPGIRFRF